MKYYLLFTWIHILVWCATTRRTGFSREGIISDDGYAATVLAPSRLKPVLREGVELLAAFDLNEPAINEPQVAVHAVLWPIDPGFDCDSAVFQLAIGSQCRWGDLALGRRAAFAQHFHSQVAFIDQGAVAAHRCVGASTQQGQGDQ